MAAVAGDVTGPVPAAAEGGGAASAEAAADAPLPAASSWCGS
ncbi:hypothetical protein [Verrucosispora sioxanthis]|nr:hypothetical protein [Verrucosispora sioxanthis]